MIGVDGVLTEPPRIGFTPSFAVFGLAEWAMPWGIGATLEAGMRVYRVERVGDPTAFEPIVEAPVVPYMAIGLSKQWLGR